MNRSAMERAYHLSMAGLLLASVVLGFARTFYFRPLFPEMHTNIPPELFFHFHGACFTAWFLLLPIQSLLIARGQLKRHRACGIAGAVLALLMLFAGTYGALIAGSRPNGFIGMPIPPKIFLAIPLSSMLLFAIFITAAILKRHDAQDHKRWILLSSISLIEAAVGRWPFAFITAPSPLPYVDASALPALMFLMPMIAWDIFSRKRLHKVTAIGGALLILITVMRMPLAQTETWNHFATWAFELVR